MEVATAIQPFGLRADMRNIIHRIKREGFIHKNNKFKKTYNNNSIKTVQCTYSSLPISASQ